MRPFSRCLCRAILIVEGTIDGNAIAMSSAVKQYKPRFTRSSIHCVNMPLSIYYKYTVKHYNGKIIHLLYIFASEL